MQWVVHSLTHLQAIQEEAITLRDPKQIDQQTNREEKV